MRTFCCDGLWGRKRGGRRLGLRDLLYSLSPWVGLVVCVVVHVVISRAAPQAGRMLAIAGSVGAGLTVGAGAAIRFGLAEPSLSTADRWAVGVAWVIAYLGLAYAYVFGVFNLGESSRRVRLLIELREAGPRGRTLPEILSVYNARTIVEARLQRLLVGGQIREQSGRYFIKRPLMLWISKAFVLLKLAFLGSASEFGSDRGRLTAREG